MKKRRIWRALRGTALVGWFLVMWSALSNASTAQFAWSAMRSATHWLDAHSWVGFVVGLGWVGVAVYWPDIKPKIAPVLRLPESTDERLDFLHRRLLESIRLQKEAATAIEKTLSSAIGPLREQERHEEKFRDRVDGLMARVSMLEERLRDRES